MTEKELEKVQVVGLGQACVDYLGGLDSYPPEDAKLELTDLHIRCGGPTSTALVTLSRLGISTSFLGALSNDPFGVNPTTLLIAL
jgi:ribokinase